MLNFKIKFIFIIFSILFLTNLFLFIFNISLIAETTSKPTFLTYKVDLMLYKNESRDIFIFLNYLNVSIDMLDVNYFEVKKTIDSYDSTIFIINIKKEGKSFIVFNVNDLNIIIKYEINIKFEDKINFEEHVNLNQSMDYFNNYFVNRIFVFFCNNIFVSQSKKEMENIKINIDIENLNLSYLLYTGLYYYVNGNYSLSSSYFSLIKDYFNNFKDKIYSYKKIDQKYKNKEKDLNLSIEDKLKNLNYFEGKIFFYSAYLISKIHILTQNDLILISNFEETLNFIYNNNLEEDEIDVFLIILLRIYFIKSEFNKIIELSTTYLNIISNSKYKNYFYYIIGYSYFYKSPPDFKNAYYYLKLVDKKFANYKIVSELINIIEKNKLNK